MFGFAISLVLIASMFRRVEVTAYPRSMPLTAEEEIAAGRLRTCPEERIGGGYRDGKFVYLKDLAE